MTISKMISLLLLTTIFNMTLQVWGHGAMTTPRQRGALVVTLLSAGTLDRNAPFDPFSHFPSGTKSTAPGAGRKSVMRAAGNKWTPYKPFDKNFRWRAGACGDPIGGPNDHVQGGKFYWPKNNPKKVKSYKQGDTVDFEVDILNHHNGYFEFYICNIDYCGYDISPKCFQDGHCRKLQRARTGCDSGTRKDCGPTDRKDRGRWYLPCGPFPSGEIIYGKKGVMKYQLPKDLNCKHCVIQWYWVSANFCNPPGLTDYFTGLDRPKSWGNCPGQNNAKGGFSRYLATCGGKNFPEEYWQCADVSISRR